MRLIDADKLKKDDELTLWLSNDAVRAGKTIKMFSELFIKKIDEQPTIEPTETVTEFADRCKECGARYGKLLKQKDKWIPISEDLLEDGKWYLFTDGKNMSVERYKADALDHFCPPGRWFQFDEAVGWMPLPIGPYEEENKMTYGDIYWEFCKKFPNAEVSDYRPAYPQYLPSLVKPIPYGIVVWLKDGSKVVYIAEEAKE